MSHIEYTIRNVGDLTSIVKALRAETNLVWWFRGHARAGWKLLPGIRRGYTPQQERYLSTEFYTRARMRHSKCPGDEDHAGWLSLMQHYGLPTRLLDWSQSPLVASFFAVSSFYRHTDHSGDAEIWALAPGLLNERHGFEPLIYPLNYRTVAPLLEPAFRTKDADEKVIAAAPIEADLRMVIQQAAFTVHASILPLRDMPGSEQWLRRIIVPEDAVPGISSELDALGIRLADLFPDLGNLANELKVRHHPPATAI